ncbi:MAG TPA: hypothetical protein VEZ46_00455, partial [Mycobacteriales bacterium]|nr:hypothetical protein [Mycobacteriales bacterium]
MALIVSGQVAGVSTDVPKRLLEIDAELTQVYAPQIAAAAAVYEAGRARREEVVAETVYRVPPEAAAFARRVIEVLDEVDEFCRAGRYLFTLAAPGDVAAYRRWSLNEVALQIEGAPPMSWPQYAAASRATSPAVTGSAGKRIRTPPGSDSRPVAVVSSACQLSTRPGSAAPSSEQAIGGAASRSRTFCRPWTSATDAARRP